MSKLIAPINTKWMCRRYEVAHIYKLWASLKKRHSGMKQTRELSTIILDTS